MWFLVHAEINSSKEKYLNIKTYHRSIDFSSSVVYIWAKQSHRGRPWRLRRRHPPCENTDANKDRFPPCFSRTVRPYPFLLSVHQQTFHPCLARYCHADDSGIPLAVASLARTSFFLVGGDTLWCNNGGQNGNLIR
ncbi:hypothetical protein Zmor_018135 [Zophobas morio]|uniref:Uncharacterized protein n=1 Tax=Zophobas morio TaxID=2755281 RepID=A0AA38IBK0_9CUCU|nr:hypothetical protein Zmor_018135 [Zophobas morio]